jgi:hypothetical protein
MNETAKSGPPVWFMVVSVLFLVWNLFGLAVFAMGMLVFNNKESLEKAGFAENQIELTLSTPTWVNIAFGIAVIFGVLGSIALVTKKKVAIPLLAISLLGVLAQNAYMYVLSDAVEVMGVGASPLVIVGAVAAVPFAMFCAKQGWLA